ncbi:MAG: 16S rRNA (cytosine(1402)-N(4))-methyltransferase RsmH [Proteobacteria bacterium]|nr:16S rRNA (cytosine(1402)-N(4))-methyltransferase RsmH [Pseudomonadota bacterium]
MSHESVLFAPTIEALSPCDGEVFVDGTLGWGGHASALVARGARVIGIDRDPDALAAARERCPAIEAHHGQYSEIPRILGEIGISRVDGLLLDLGVSSPQLDRAERGFSFARSGPLDMRMDPTRGPTALEFLRATDATALANVLFEYGEERHSKKIARLIVDAIAADTVHTTLDLAAVIAKGIPFSEQRKSKIHAATRSFQAIRIAVNAELDELATFLAWFPDLLAPGGRCAVISFHSLEDRLVKNAFRDLAWTTSLPERFAVDQGERVHAVCEPIVRKAVVATDEEIAQNPRARSARLRAVRRTTAPNLPMIRPGS